MANSFLDLPQRNTKPRNAGLTIVLDPGLPAQRFSDSVHSHHYLIDFVKFGWGTSFVSSDIQRKVECLQSLSIGYFFGGTLFEKAVYQKKFDEFYDYLKQFGCRYVEVSNGIIEMSQIEKSRLIEQLAKDFIVLSEVGYKDSTKSENMHPAKWVECIARDIGAGAYKVILESRESGNSGICRPNGELRYGLIEEIIEESTSIEDIVFESPTNYLQAYFVKRLGPNVNLGNIALDDLVGLETLRLGLRADTFFLIE